MKRKILIVLLVSFIIGLIISCYKISDLYVYYNTQVDSIRTSNGIIENSYYKIYNKDSIPFGKFSLIIRFYLKDSLIKYVKQTAFIKNFSMFQNAYSASSTGEIIKFTTNDSIQSINIKNLFPFNDSLKANSNLKGKYSSSYQTYYSWNDTIDSIGKTIHINNLQGLNQLFNNTSRQFNNIALFLIINEQPKYTKQKFIVNINFQSGRKISDTTKLIYLE